MKLLKKLIKTLLIAIALIVVFIGLFFGHSAIPLDKLKAKYAPSPSAFITMGGMNVHYRDEGPKTDTIPIVLIHGTSSSLHTFEGWTAKLKDSHRVLRMDLPGFGLTGPFPNRDYSIAHYVSFINQFLEVKNVKQCVLAGNSLGGNIAWRYAVKYPNKVNKLVLIDASGYPLKSKSVPMAFRLAKTPVLNKLLTFITPRFMAKSSVENVYVDKSKITPKLVDRYFELTLRKGNRQALIDRMRDLEVSDTLQIKNITKPTLVLWGAKDLLIPINNALKFHRDLPNDTLVIIKNTGHVPMEENPEESLVAFNSFLKKY